jgi:hypothetical protein
MVYIVTANVADFSLWGYLAIPTFLFTCKRIYPRSYVYLTFKRKSIQHQTYMTSINRPLMSTTCYYNFWPQYLCYVLVPLCEIVP